jgi:FAD/FMN-containing dehydrogenase
MQNPNGHWPQDRLSRLDNFGHSMHSAAYVFRPSRVEQVEALFEQARQRGTPVTFRGSGRSYGDASLNAGGMVIDTRRLDRVLEWNPDSGVIIVEPGVTIEKLWKHTLEDGWWPPVVPGTMFPTLGGCLGTNIHGKNNWQMGTIGEHVLEFEALLPDGRTLICSPQENTDYFHAMIGGIGMLGMFSKITLQMKRIYSGNLWVTAWTEGSLKEMLAAVETGKAANDYVVGWLDCLAQGANLGRGQIHSADYLAEGDDPAPGQSLLVERQALPDTFFGLVPKSILYRFIRPAMNNFGVKMVNSLKFTANNSLGNGKRFLQSHVAFNFLLDYIPNWEKAYGAQGLIQYQCFIPQASAEDAFREIIQQGLRRGLPNYLGVLKRHRPDPFLLTHAVDGFSLAQDYRVTQGRRAGLLKLTEAMNEIVLEAGGRFYFAKDGVIRRKVVQRYLGIETMDTFRQLKAASDPESLLESDLYRRCFYSER